MFVVTFTVDCNEFWVKGDMCHTFTTHLSTCGCCISLQHVFMDIHDTSKVQCTGKG